MGGSALGRPASRLSTPQLESLIIHSQTRLAPYFSQTLPLFSFSDKSSHGDLDLVCAHVIPFDPKKVKGEDWGVLSDKGEDKGPGAWHPVQGGKRDAEQGKEGEENARFRAWVVEIVRTMGGTEWKRSGVSNAFLNVGLPVTAVENLPGDVIAENPNDQRRVHEHFYQVDLQIIAPEHLVFTQFSRSWSNVLLTHALTLLSPHLKLHGTHMGFHYSPYPGLEPIKFELTAVPADMCNWLGLDYGRYEQGFKNEKELWLWATDIRPFLDKDGKEVGQGKIREAWQILVKPDTRRRKEGVIPRKGKSEKGKNPTWLAFLNWLRRGEDSPFRKEYVPRPPRANIDVVNSPDDKPTTSEQNATALAQTPTKTDSAVPHPTPPHSPQANQNIIDVDNPTVLCPNAKEALVWWSRWEELQRVMQSKGEVAEARAASQRKNVEDAENSREVKVRLEGSAVSALKPAPSVSAEVTA